MENTGVFVIDLLNAEGSPAEEPNCLVEFIRLDGVSLLQSDHLEFPPRHRFTVPAFPQGRNLHCRITPSRYRGMQSEFFTLDAGKEIGQPITAMRDPSAWQPAFTTWNALSAQFDPLKKTIERLSTTSAPAQNLLGHKRTTISRLPCRPADLSRRLQRLVWHLRRA